MNQTINATQSGVGWLWALGRILPQRPALVFMVKSTPPLSRMLLKSVNPP